MITRAGIVPKGTSSVGSIPTPNANPTGIPLDAEGRIALQQAAAARNTYMQSLVQQQQQLNQNYGTQLHSYTEQHPLDVSAQTNQYAGSGLGFSSGFGNAQGLLNQKYKDALASLLQTKTQGTSQIGSERQTYNQEYGTDLDAIRQAAADRLVANKQTLGLATGTTNPSKIAQLLNGN